MGWDWFDLVSMGSLSYRRLEGLRSIDLFRAGSRVQGRYRRYIYMRYIGYIGYIYIYSRDII